MAYSTPKIPKLLKDKENTAEWLVQPTAVTFMRYNYSLIQSKAFMQIIKALQSAIQEAIYNSNNRISAEPSIFSDEKFNDGRDPNSIYLKMPMSSFGIPKNQYKELKEGLMAMASVPVSIPYKDSQGRAWMKYTGLCTVILPEDKHISYVYVEIKKDTALRLLNIDFGFTRFLQSVIMSSKNAYTPRLYLYLSQAVYNGGCEITYGDFRSYLRLGTKYGRFNDLVKRILEPTKKELRDKYDDGISNFFFEWVPAYNKGSRKAGAPDRLVFKIVSRDIQDTERQTLQIRQRQVYDLLRSQRIMMEERYAVEIQGRVTAENHMGVLCKISELAEVLSNPASGIKFPSRYVYAALTKYLDEELVAGETAGN